MGKKIDYKYLGSVYAVSYERLEGRLDLKPLGVVGGAATLHITTQRGGGGWYQYGATGKPTYNLYDAHGDTNTPIGAIWLKTVGIGKTYMSGYLQTNTGKLLLSLFKSDKAGERDKVWVVKGGFPPADESDIEPDAPLDRPF